MKSVGFLGAVVTLILLSQAGIGYLAFNLDSRKNALVEIQQHELGRLEKLRALVGEREADLDHLESRKAKREGQLTSLEKQIESIELVMEEKTIKVRQLQLEEKRLGGITDKSEKTARQLASLEAASAETQAGLESRQKEAALLEAKVRRLMDEFEALTRDSAFLKSAESRVHSNTAPGGLGSKQKQRPSWEEDIDARWSEVGTPNGLDLNREDKD